MSQRALLVLCHEDVLPLRCTADAFGASLDTVVEMLMSLQRDEYSAA
ncbi:TPA: hypothetical protein HH295_13495 [Xanthomonas vasicola pv. zeae]|nr:hypothetical protein [Xanthomonas vasicola]MBV6742959.1 hypothetical protein [Xanthomonas vasicola pv. musacearum NCPPB 2251]MBV6747642.1 hypothetical protein [Xanthomonas vasicola pv. vasculorum NCPPB 890]MBV6893229.1 hypothetical protein [Xanthomonas vasicola pv. vasculorum]MBV7279289.1 hypothetical protein [Xanthomonas vasicola pv. musacearum]MBV7290619.1 hypothetical protein [Xanthomonas vasicola pv. musacearum]